ncbi:MAG TPA: hypothetical protein VMW83_14695 [Spirochaetia bacterium]|nr:hypothetical protein [Spirochaetia bacterium]
MSDVLRKVVEEELADLLKSLTPEEIESLDVLMDDEASVVIAQSIRDVSDGKVIPTDE